MRSAPVRIAQVITGAALGMALLYFLRTILVPFVIAFVLAVLVDAFVRSIVRRWPKAPGWAVAGFAGAVIGIGAFTAFYVIAQGAVEMVQQGPALIARLEQLVHQAGRPSGWTSRFISAPSSDGSVSPSWPVTCWRVRRASSRACS